MRPGLRCRSILRSCAPATLSLLLAACSAAVVDDPAPGATQTATADLSTPATAASASTSPDLLGFPSPSHSICTQFDDDFLGVASGAACAHSSGPTCPDRVDTWDNTIVFDFAIALTSDCRFGHFSDGTVLSSSDVADYLNALLPYTLTFLGCPIPGSGVGPLAFGLIPPSLQSSTFTTADLNAMSALYSAAIAQALSDNGSPPLTRLQTLAIDAKLLVEELTVKNVVRSSKFTYSTCTP
jgi:hypothetical protein